MKRRAALGFVLLAAPVAATAGWELAHVVAPTPAVEAAPLPALKAWTVEAARAQAALQDVHDLITPPHVHDDTARADSAGAR